MVIERMNITRRSFLIGAGAASLAVTLPAIVATSEYVRFMEPPEMWAREWGKDFVKHQTVWRASKDGEHKTYGLGVHVSKEDEVEGHVERIMVSYNRALENTLSLIHI